MMLTELLLKVREWGSDFRLEIDCPENDPRIRLSWTCPVTGDVLFVDTFVAGVVVAAAYSGAIEQHLERTLKEAHEKLGE